MYKYSAELYREFMQKKSSPADELGENEVLYNHHLEGLES